MYQTTHIRQPTALPATQIQEKLVKIPIPVKGFHTPIRTWPVKKEVNEQTFRFQIRERECVYYAFFFMAMKISLNFIMFLIPMKFFINCEKVDFLDNILIWKLIIRSQNISLLRNLKMLLKIIFISKANNLWLLHRNQYKVYFILNLQNEVKVLEENL